MSQTPTRNETAELRFEFGKNWASFAATLDEAKIRESENRLVALLETDSLRGLSFLDIGCGSGLHSLAALRLGAERVWAIDLDPNSVGTAQAVLARWWPSQNYRVERKSVFALETDLPEPFDIVYSWGVLHHTGEMARAIRAACRAVKPGGRLALALYGKTRYCGIWRRIKRWYVQATPEQTKRAEDWYVRLFGVWIFITTCATGSAATRTNRSALASCAPSSSRSALRSRSRRSSAVPACSVPETTNTFSAAC